MSEHTKEPWHVRADEDHWSDNDSVYIVGNPTGEAGGNRKLALMIDSWEKPMPNGRRIVACVNACVGIGTEYLEKFGGTSFNHFKQVKLQRDELLEASRLILKSFSYAPGNGPEWYEAARKAVASAEAA